MSGAKVGVLGSLFLVRGDSMTPTLRSGDLIHVRPTSAMRSNLERGSVVVAEMRAPEVENRLVASVKRVVGLPGELVRIQDDGAVRIDDETLEEPYLAPEARMLAGPGLTWLCDDDEYFLIGDNRADSADSRRYGPVPVSSIVGAMWLRLPTHRLLGRTRPAPAI